MAKNKRKGRRAKPKGTRRPHLRHAGDPASYGSLLSHMDRLIDSAGRDLLKEDDPITAETWGSIMVDGFEATRLKARLDGIEVPSIEEAFLQRSRSRRDKHGAVVAAALAGVLPPPHDRTAASVASELFRSVPGLPAWVERVGESRPTRSWVASDNFGDLEALVVGFVQEGESSEHALVVIVDHNLSGQATDAWIAADFESFLDHWKSSEEMQMHGSEAPLDETLARLRDAMAISDSWDGDTELRSEEFAAHRALVWARLRRAGIASDQPPDLEMTQAERAGLVGEFMASAQGRRLASSLAASDVELLAGYLVDMRCDYEGRPLRWSPSVVSLLLGYLAPRKLLLDAGQAAALPAVVRAFVEFSGERTGLGQRFVEKTLEEVDGVEAEYLDLINDRAAAGPAKALLIELQARGVDLTDINAVKQALEEAGPVRLPGAAPQPRQTSNAPAEVVAFAEAATVLARFKTLGDFFGEGRKLTQAGHPTMADARSLVALLGTRDRLEHKFGVSTYKTRSAGELPELGFMIRWATAAGALRMEDGKLCANAAWAGLTGDPLERWTRAAGALPSLGPLAAYFTKRRFRLPGELLDKLAPEILAILIQGEVPFDSVLDWTCQRADAAYEWTGPTMKDPKFRRTWFGWDLDLLARILEWAGITVRIGARVEPALYDREHLVGGTLQLTPAGRWWLGN